MTLRPPRIGTIILIVAIVAALGVVCTFGFTNSEDESLIVRNPNFNPPTLVGLWNHWRAPHLYLYIPMTYTAWWVLAAMGQMQTPDENGALLNPWLFHSANLLLHIVTSVLVLQLLRRLTHREGPAVIGALLFALHPIQVEAVAWTTGTKDVLCGAFAFAALLLYVKYIQDDDHNTHAGAERSAAPGRSHFPTETANSPERRCALPRRGSYVLASVFLLFALLSKPVAVVVPIMAFILDYFILSRPLRPVLRSLAPWFVLTIPFLILAPLIQPAHEVTPAPFWSRPFIAGDALAFYLWKIVWPFGLTLHYSRPPRAVLQSGAAYWTWLIPAGVAVLLIIRRNRWLTAAGLLFVAGVLPVLGPTTFLFQRYSTVADRFVYLSMFGLALAVAWVLSQKWNRPIAITCAVILLLLGIRTGMQALTWRDRRSLYSHAVAVSPQSAAAHSNWGIVLKRAGDLPAAEAEYRRAIAIEPDLLAARQNLVNLLTAEGRTTEAEEESKAMERLKTD